MYMNDILHEWNIHERHCTWITHVLSYTSVIRTVYVPTVCMHNQTVLKIRSQYTMCMLAVLYINNISLGCCSKTAGVVSNIYLCCCDVIHFVEIAF